MIKQEDLDRLELQARRQVMSADCASTETLNLIECIEEINQLRLILDEIERAVKLDDEDDTISVIDCVDRLVKEHNNAIRAAAGKEQS